MKRGTNKEKKQTISTSDVSHVAKLARLHFGGNKIEKFRDQLSNIFKYVNQIGSMKTGNVEETSQVTGTMNRFRQDKVKKENMLSQKQALSNAKERHKGYFVVKSIFKD